MIDTVMEFDWQKNGQDSRPRPMLTLVSGDANAGEFSKSGCEFTRAKKKRRGDPDECAFD